ncbi:MAG: D-glycero-beta-D-manno-heptose 1-phosphate adenylyltransferase [Pseudobutyrivibrio sp.]|nr:D-glycero-beta-D-manno-heptose 1-phosphate adenylyltransferase [Pseudobutyrivibrio sp.]
MKSKIVSLDFLVSQVSDLKAKGKVVAATGGCFDILHAGHVEYLEKAKSLGDFLVLFLNSDSSVRRLKGDERPIVPQDERAIVVAALECVDYVCVFQEDTPCDVIAKVQPDIWTKGADYRDRKIPEQEIIESYGGSIAYIDFVDGCSSTNIVRKIIKTYTGDMK